MLALVVKEEVPANDNATAPVIAPVFAVAVKPLNVESPVENAILGEFKSMIVILVLFAEVIPFTVMAVSYTHLTLPTILLV